MRHRNFCFTINNPTNEDRAKLLETPYRYLVYGEEKGESGTPHLQGYCELRNQMRLNAIKAHMPRAHIEARRGTARQAADYCKKDGQYIEHGTMSRPGRRSDIDSLYSLAREGKSDYEMAESTGSTFMRYYKGAREVRFVYQSHDTAWRPVEVQVYYGGPGTGKTRKAYEIDPSLYRVNFSTSTIWFDGYSGQETILLDDYRGEIPLSYFLQLTDGYRFQLPVKGGHTWKMWKRVIITSNRHPNDWYRNITPESQAAIIRRITTVSRVG